MIRSLIFVTLVLLSTQAQEDPLPVLDMDGFTWAENLGFDGLGNMFVSDPVVGKLWRIYLDPSTNKYEKVVHLDTYDRFLGIAFEQTPSGPIGYVVADEGPTFNRNHYIVQFDPTPAGALPVKHSVAAKLPHGGNGLAYFGGDRTLFATHEGGPNEPGVVMRAWLSNGTAEVVANIDGANGAAVDENTGQLHVGSLFGAYFTTFQLPNMTLVQKNDAPGMFSIDDFCLSRDGTVRFATDFMFSHVVASSQKGMAYVIQNDASYNLRFPTAAKWGFGPGFNSSLLYVTEGGGILPRDTSQRVLQMEPRAMPVMAGG